MSELPTGAVTFLFTDIEGSTRMWESDPGGMTAALQHHDGVLTTLIADFGGVLFKHTGDGVCAAFASPSDAIAAAAAAEAAIRSEPDAARLKIRVGLHTGEAEVRDGDYFGITLSRAARLMDAAHGGQVLVSSSSAALLGELPDDLSLTDLGEHRLKDLSGREHIFQLTGAELQLEFPPIRTLDAVDNNLPEQLSAFVGRRSELAMVRDMLRQDRLVTLTGVGGMGKTRLAVQAAAESLAEFPGGIFLVELAPIADDDFLLAEIARSLGVPEQASRPLMDTIIDFLASRDALLILDNCEHLIGGAAKAAEVLLRGAPRLRILATSREGLSVAGERLWQVPPMQFEDDGTDAIDLFVARARLIRPDFEVAGEVADAVGQICRRLDGVPLAIELATARLKVFSAAQIAERLDDRFRLLTGGSRTALERQRTLRATMDWSYDLLTEHEQALLRRLSVFFGGFDFESAEEVCSGDLVPEFEVLELLAHLVETSMVVAEDGERIRYHLLETVRQYGMDKLVEAGEADDARLRHADYFVSIADQVDEALLGSDHLPWMHRLETEHDNFRAALTWTLEHGRADISLALTAGLGRFWFYHTHYREATGWQERALAEATDEPSRHRVLTAASLAGILLHLGRYEHSAQRAEEALEMARALEDADLIARGLNGVASAENSQGLYAQASGHFEEAFEAAAANPVYQPVPLLNLALNAANMGEAERCRELLDRFAGYERLLQNAETGAWIAGVEGVLATYTGDADAMREAYTRSLQLSGRSGQQLVEGWAYSGLADVARLEGDLDAAEEWLSRADVVAEETGAATVETLVHWLRLKMATDAGDLDAIKEQGTALMTGRARLDIVQQARVAMSAGFVLADTDPERAATLLAAADARYQLSGAARAVAEERQFSELVFELPGRIGEEAFAESSRRGAGLSASELLDAIASLG